MHGEVLNYGFANHRRARSSPKTATYLAFADPTCAVENKRTFGAKSKTRRRVNALNTRLLTSKNHQVHPNETRRSRPPSESECDEGERDRVEGGVGSMDTASKFLDAPVGEYRIF